MNLLALVAAVLGGGCWTARWVVDLTSEDPTWGETAHWAGLVLLGVAVAVFGAGLVSKSALWLRLIVAAAAPLLAWSVYAVAKGEREGIALDGVLGIAAIVVAILGWVRGRAKRASVRRAHGAHSAR